MKIFFKFHLFKEFLFLSHCVYPNKSNESFLQISSFYEFLFLSFNIYTNEMKVFMQYKIYCFVQECCWVINQLPNRPWPVAIHQDISEFNIPLAQKYFSTMNKKKTRTVSQCYKSITQFQKGCYTYLISLLSYQLVPS